MKKLASRVLALVIALSMLLASTAMAAERNAATLSVGNFEITVGEDTLSLPVILSVGGGVDIEGMRGYLTADVSTETASALSALAAFENGEIKAQLSGMDYGFTVTLEQIIALIEAELGMTIEEAMAEIMGELEVAFDAETQAALGGMMESAAALDNLELDPQAVAAALGFTMTENGEASVTLFDVETTAAEYAIELKEQTCKEMFDALASLDPALAAYIDDYFAMMNEELAASGEEMTVEEALSMITFGLNGVVYEAEAGALAELTMTMSADGETIELPLGFVTLTDESGSYAEFYTLLTVDGESLYFDIYTDDFTAEGAAYSNFIVTLAVGDSDAEENDVEFVFSILNVDDAESDAIYLDFSVLNYGETVSGGVGYVGYPAVYTEEADSYDGILNVYLNAEGMTLDAYAGTNLTLTSVPEGELLPLPQSINPLEADEEMLSQIMTDAQNALIQGLGVLMQDPTLSSLIGSMMF